MYTVANSCNSSSQKVETMEGPVQGQLGLYNKLEATLGYLAPFLRTKMKTVGVVAQLVESSPSIREALSSVLGIK